MPRLPNPAAPSRRTTGEAGASPGRRAESRGLNGARAILAGLAVALAAGCTGEVCPGLTRCGETCADLSSSPSHCGACGRACAEGEVCVEGACRALSCSDECPALGAIACAEPLRNGLMVCVDFVDEDDCLEWGGYTPCAEDETCIDGACSGSCGDECAEPGERRCEGAGYRQCGQHDGDDCLEWSEITPCGEGETCTGGVCSGETCTDECAEGAADCQDNGVRTCGQHDADPCLEWSTVEPCGDGETCIDGRCEAPECTEEGEDCVCGDDECCEGHCCPVLFVCVSSWPDEDYCPFGSGD